MFVWGYLGFLWALIRLGLLSGDTWAKSHDTHNAPLFPTGEFDFPLLEKYRVFDLFVVGKEGTLMLACSNVHVSGESYIFGKAFGTDF